MFGRVKRVTEHICTRLQKQCFVGLFVCLLLWGFYACVVVVVAAGDFWVGSFIFIFDNFYFVLKGNKIPAALHLFLALHPL